jgi:hypothetical protein
VTEEYVFANISCNSIEMARVLEDIATNMRRIWRNAADWSERWKDLIDDRYSRGKIER